MQHSASDTARFRQHQQHQQQQQQQASYRLSRYLQRFKHGLQWAWHFRARFLFGRMQESQALQSDHHHAQDGLGDGGTSRMRCGWNFDTTVVANHLYLFISSGYLTFNLYRILRSDSTSSNHATFMLVSDCILLILASLFVLDALIYAYIHATSIDLPDSSTTDHIQALNDLASASRGPSPKRSHLVPSQNGLTVSPSNGAGTMNNVRIEVEPFHDGDDGEDTEDQTAPLKSSSPSSRAHSRFHLEFLKSAFLSTADGVAELLNVIGAFGYLITALIPFWYFITSEEAERTLDRTANVIDNASMMVFVVDSWIYLGLWRRKESRVAALQASRRSLGGENEEDEERSKLIGNGEVKSKTPNSSRPTSPSAAASTASRDLTIAPSSSSSPPLRSVFSSSERDIYFYGNLCNILAGSLYLASTVYGFAIRQQANEDLSAIREMAREMDRAASPSLPSTTSLYTSAAAQSGHRAYGLVTRMLGAGAGAVGGAAGQQSNSELLRAASTLLHDDPTFTSWEAEIAQQFHWQMCIAFVGDCLYFLCALCEEIAHYSSVSQERRERKSERSTSEIQMEETRTSSSLRTIAVTREEEEELSPEGPSPPNDAMRRIAHQGSTSPLAQTLPPSATFSRYPAERGGGAGDQMMDGGVVVRLVEDDPTMSLSPNSPPSLRS